jgi:hypothetical protein
MTEEPLPGIRVDAANAAEKNTAAADRYEGRRKSHADSASRTAAQGCSDTTGRNG